MNVTALLDFESRRYYGLQSQASHINSAVVNSLRCLIEHFFLHIAPFFMITLSCRRESPLNFYKSIMQELYNSVDNMIIQMVHVDHHKLEHIEGPRLHNLLLVDSLEAFLDIDIISYTADYDTNEYYHIFLQQRDHIIEGEMQAIFEYCWKHQLINCNIQIQTAAGEVYMYSYFPYTENHCERVVPVKTNQFIDNRWQHKDFFPAKLRNFHQCPLTAAVRDVPPFLALQNDNHGNYILGGFEGHLINQLAAQLNFTIKAVIPAMDDRTLNDCCGGIAMLQSRKAHLDFGYHRKRGVLREKITTTVPHYQSTVVDSIFLNAHNLTSSQILTFPFQPSTWLAIFIMILLTFITAQLFFFCTMGGKMYSRGLAIFGIIGTMLGIPQDNIPQQLHIRLHYTSWLWASFIMRTIYLALLFHLFRSNVHQELPTQLIELLYEDYVAVMNQFTLNDVLQVPTFDAYVSMRSKIINSSSDFAALEYLEQHLTDRHTAATAREFLVYYATTRRRPGMFYIVQESVMHQQLTIFLRKHSYLVHQLDACILDIQAVGLLEFWSRWEMSDKYFKSTHLFGDKLIGQSELWGIYLMASCLHALALIVFIGELVLNKYRKKNLKQIALSKWSTESTTTSTNKKT